MIKITERGWAGHFCAANRCYFRRNTLLDNQNGVQIIVSTVGNMYLDAYDEPQEIRSGYHYETLVFRAKQDGEYIEIDVCQELGYFDVLAITKENKPYVDNLANDMHQAMLLVIADAINSGDISVESLDDAKLRYELRREL